MKTKKISLESRWFIAFAVFVALLLNGCDPQVAPEPPAIVNTPAVCASAPDIVFANGRFLTVDENDSVASVVRVRGDRITTVGDDPGPVDACTQTIDLEERTVIPGLINDHVHYLRGGMRPGHNVHEVQTAFSITELQESVRRRAASVPVVDEPTGNDFITVIANWSPAQFAENRQPTLQELDETAPDHPVFMMRGQVGPGVVNSKGKLFMEARGIPVGEDGSITAEQGASPTDALRALLVLKSDQTLEDKKRALRDLMRYSNTVGLMTVVDGGGSMPGTGVFNEYEDYEAIMALWREDALTVRFRTEFQSAALDETGIPAIQARVDNTFMDLGDDMFKVSGFGENIVREMNPIRPLELFVEAFTIAAENGWKVQQHSIDVEELERHTTAFEIVNAEIPLADLHWSLSHVEEIDQGILERLSAMGVGVSTQMHWYSGFFGMGDVGPPWRLILDSGVVMGAGSDGMSIPWKWIYHMTTGRTMSGDPILEDQKVTRMEALRASTMGSAWIAKSEHELGSIEPGKLADFVVLSDDYLTVPDEELLNLKSVLSVLGGAVVYSDGSVVACGADSSPWYREDPTEGCQID